MRTAILCSVLLALLLPSLRGETDTQRLRDPFWPLGYTPGQDAPETAAPEVDQPAAPEPVVLSDEELRELAREEARNIQASLETQGIAVMGGRIYGYIQGRWVTVGDSFTITVMGREYRLLITRLTATEIELEPFRIPTQ